MSKRKRNNKSFPADPRRGVRGTPCQVLPATKRRDCWLVRQLLKFEKSYFTSQVVKINASLAELWKTYKSWINFVLDGALLITGCFLMDEPINTIAFVTLKRASFALVSRFYKPS